MPSIPFLIARYFEPLTVMIVLMKKTWFRPLAGVVVVSIPVVVASSTAKKRVISHRIACWANVVSVN